MRNVTETWRRMTLPLDRTDKSTLIILALGLAWQLILFIDTVSLTSLTFVLYHAACLMLVWMCAWNIGARRIARPMTAMGVAVAKDLHEYGDLLISKHGKEYRVTPLTHSRDT